MRTEHCLFQQHYWYYEYNTAFPQQENEKNWIENVYFNESI